MQCEAVALKLLDLIDEELPSGQRAEVLTHLRDCATCAAEFSVYRDLLTRVQADPVPEPSPSFWEELLPSLKQRIERETFRREPASSAWLAGVGSWFAFRPRLIAGLAVAAVSMFIIVRLPGVLFLRTDRPTVPIVTERVGGQYGDSRNASMTPYPDNGNRASGESLVVAGEVVDEPSIMVAAIAQLRGVDEIADRLETAWIQRPEADLSDSLASLNDEERQILLDRLSNLKWTES